MGKLKTPRPTLNAKFHAIQTTVLWASAAYAAVVIAGLTAVKLIGEAYWLTGILLFLPPFGWLSPLLILAPLALCYARVACLFQLTAILMVTGVYLRFQWHRPPFPSGKALTILSNNTGQRDTGRLVTFVNQVKPDLIALQDALPGLSEQLQGKRERTHTAKVGEFVLVSRFPIVRSGPVELPGSPNTPLAAWFEIDTGDHTIVLYNVHFPTPRPLFAQLRGQGFRAELIRGGGIYSREVREQVTAAMRQNLSLAEELIRALADQPLPFLVVGDFNAPGPSRAQGLFRAAWTDFHSAAGRGYGLTFPGTTRNPLAGFGPWLRLDYLFASVGIRPLDTWVEPRGPAQHLAVVGRFEIRALKTQPVAPKQATPSEE